MIFDTNLIYIESSRLVRTIQCDSPTLMEYLYKRTLLSNIDLHVIREISDHLIRNRRCLQAF